MICELVQAVTNTLSPSGFVAARVSEVRIPFKLGSSNTEPVIQLNVEGGAYERLVQDKVRELLAILDQLG